MRHCAGTRLWVGWAAAAMVLVGGARALAQSGEYRMDEAGDWKPAESRPLTADEATMARARKLLADEKFWSARRLLRDWLEANSKSESPQLPLAYRLRGDARTADKDEYEGLRDYEAVCIQFPGTEEYVRAIERELEIAIRYVNGYRRKFLGMRIQPADDIGEELLVRVQERLPQSRLAERAGIELADYYYRNRDLSLASEAYDLFVQNFPRSRFADRARVQRIYSEIGRYKGPEYDGSGLADAKILIQGYAEVNPLGAQREGLTDALVSRLDESAGASVLVRAKWYIRRGDLVSARATLRRLLATHPRTLAAREGMDILDANQWTYAAPTKGNAMTENGKVPLDAAQPATETPAEKKAGEGGMP
ncbi:MAG: outer membrane protein assembly factor BamD [Phycisphaerales bacterium]